jgi:hypothetical protein
MINWWDQKAARLQQSVRADEREGSDDYSDGDLKRSVVHARVAGFPPLFSQSAASGN